jgi:two-component system chemotaxis sensor kinase CheA
VVRTNIDQIGGTIDIKSVAGEGSSVTIKIPLTLAIVSALIVEAAGDRFAIPQLSVVELVRARANSEHRIERIKDTAVLRLRNKLLPLMHLKKLLKIDDGSSSDPENGFIVVTQVGSQTFGIVVDGVFHTEEIVVKPMSTKLRHIEMFSGNTILGDGAVIMIIDPNGIAKALGTSVVASHEIAEDNAASRASAEQLTSLLVFRAGTSQPKAVPLGLVTRLEEIAIDKIELSNGRYMVQYREQLMPLVQMAGVNVQTTGAQPILVFADDGRSMGLVVDEIIDIVEERLHIEVAGSQDGILGSAVIKGQATEVIDVGHFLPMAFADWFSRKEMRPSVTAQSVLLVDDSAFFRNMLAPVLKAAGYRVRVAPSAQEGLVALRSGQAFDVVLTDIEMPEMNGFEFAEVIRADQHLNAMPIIALSSMVSPAAIERGRLAGFHDYVAKFDRPGLIAALKEQTAELSRVAA